MQSKTYYLNFDTVVMIVSKRQFLTTLVTKLLSTCASHVIATMRSLAEHFTLRTLAHSDPHDALVTSQSV